MNLPPLPAPLGTPASMTLPPLLVPAHNFVGNEIKNPQLAAYCQATAKSITKTAQAVMVEVNDMLTVEVTDTVTLKYELTDWFPMGINPVRDGEYELMDDETGELWRGNFSGGYWEHGHCPTHWRGIRGLLWPGVDSLVIPTT